MAEVPFNKLPRSAALYYVAQQRLYSPGQVEMAKEMRGLLWVKPPNRSLRPSLRLEVFRLKGPDCVYCNLPLTEKTFTVDHIKPFARGGKNHLKNLTVACRSCNSKKGARRWVL